MRRRRRGQENEKRNERRVEKLLCRRKRISSAKSRRERERDIEWERGRATRPARMALKSELNGLLDSYTAGGGSRRGKIGRGKERGSWSRQSTSRV